MLLPEVKALSSQKRRGSIEVDHYPPVARSKTHKDCKFTFACDICDNQVLKPTDSVQAFAPQGQETVFKLGLRTFAAYTAWYDGHKRWAKEELSRNPNRLLLLKRYPFLQPAFKALSDWGAQQTSIGKQLESEMQRWRNAYQISSWNQAVSHVVEASIKPRIAGCGIQNQPGCPVAVTILPSNSGMAFVIATTLLDGAALPSFPNQQSATQEVANEWKRRFDNQSPEQWLPDLSQLCEFLYVSPEDYHDESVVSETARHAIAAKISSIPDVLTDDPREILLQGDPP